MRILFWTTIWGLLLGGESAAVVRAQGESGGGPFPRRESVVMAKTGLYRTHPAPRVTVRGWVTYWSPVLGLAVLHDQTGGMLFYPKGLKSEHDSIRVGSHVELTGVMAQVEGHGAWQLVGDRVQAGKYTAPQVRMIGFDYQGMPKALAANLSYFEDRVGMLSRVITEGTVRRVVASAKDEPLRVEVSSPTGYVMARLPRTFPVNELSAAVNRRVRMSGVALNRGPAQWLDEDSDGTLLIHNAGGFHVLPEPDPVLTPTMALGELKRVVEDSGVTQWARVEGVVTGFRPGHSFFLRLADGVVEVRTRQSPSPLPGTRGAVIGLVQNRAPRPLLLDGTFQAMQLSAVIKPTEINGWPMEGEDLHGDWVSVEGVVYAASAEGPQVRVWMDGPQGVKLNVQVLSRTGEPVSPEKLPELGSELRATGLCLTSGTSLNRFDGSAFMVQMRGQDGLEVLKAAPWWTPERVSRVMWASLSGVVLLGVGAFAMNRTMMKQRWRLAKLERLQGVDQERRRIARELHDSLQQELASATMQLETLGSCAVTITGSERDLLKDATRLLQRCQAEARNCIWNLRSLDDDRSLSEVLAAWLAQKKAKQQGVELTLAVLQPLPELSEDQNFEVMRIVQESVQNALKHAGARSVSVTLRSDGAAGMEVLIEDDGRGFDEGMAPADAEGHFGISILKERAQRIAARVDVRSEVTKGTRVRLVLPEPVQSTKQP